jgi:hypothetical protein
MKNCKLKIKELLIMKNLYPFLFLLLFGLNVQAQTQISTTDKQFATFQQNVEKWKDAYNSGDAQNLVVLYA